MSKDIVIYKTEDGKQAVEVKLDKETVWLTQKQMSELFKTERSVITKHIKNIFKTGELQPKSNVQKMHIANSDKPVSFYNLDMIISVGYRVNSKRGTQFRIWATNVLKSYLVNGYALNEKRLREIVSRLDKHDKEVQNWLKDLKNLYTSKDKVNRVLKTYFTGNIKQVSIGNQAVSLQVEKGDFETVKQYLKHHGVASQDITGLKEVITKEKKLGDKVQSWIGKMLVKAMKGTWKTGTATAGDILKEAVKGYLGL